MLTTVVSHEPGGTVVRLTGELDMESAPQLEQCVAKQLASGRVHLVLHLEALDFCDSRGIATLIMTARRCQDAGGWARLSGAIGAVRRVLDMTGVAELFADGTPLNSSFGSGAQGSPRRDAG